MKKWFLLPLLLITVVGYGQVYNADAIETDAKPKFDASTSISISSTAIVIQTQGQPAQHYQVDEALHPLKDYTTWSAKDGSSLTLDESQKMLVVTRTGKDFTAYHHLRLIKP